ncbi:MAG: hypothetical protein QN134_05960 [Armatimonadota bacterium]|nr:hypothetical protein [Armatimonadota bacterium]
MPSGKPLWPVAPPAAPERRACSTLRQLLHELRAQGYPGGKTILKDYLRPYRPARTPRAVVRFEPQSEEQAQVDWGEFAYTDAPSRRRKLYGFVMVLSYSRAQRA